MSEFDVRNPEKHITSIVVASRDSSNLMYVLSLQQANHKDQNRVLVTVQDRDERFVIGSKIHALNLIKGIEKAIELGWLEE